MGGDCKVENDTNSNLKSVRVEKVNDVKRYLGRKNQRTSCVIEGEEERKFQGWQPDFWLVQQNGQ